MKRLHDFFRVDLPDSWPPVPATLMVVWYAFGCNVLLEVVLQEVFERRLVSLLDEDVRLVHGHFLVPIVDSVAGSSSE